MDVHELLPTWISEFQPRLMKVAYCLMRDMYLAQDCVQETFIKAMLHANELRDISRAEQWLNKILVNECKSYARTGWFRAKPAELDLDHNRDNTVNTEHNVIMGEFDDIVLRLPRRYLIPIVLFYYQGFSSRDISNILNIRESTCRVRLHRAREILRGNLTKEGYHAE